MSMDNRGITTVPPKLRTSDGREFTNPKEAERHQEMLSAREAFADAHRKLGRALARTQTTADGEPFDFGVFRTYYYVREPYGQTPRLGEVSFYAFDFSFTERDDVFTIIQRDKGNETHYHINELYLHRDNAERALLAALEAWLVRQTEAVNELRARLGG